MKILFSNAHFVAIDKPAEVLSVPSRFSDNEEERDERPVAGRELQEQLSETLFPVHRLDFEVSGILLFAKNKKAHVIANAWFENKLIKKTYVAITASKVNSAEAKSVSQGESFEWKCKLLRGKKRAYESPHGKDSLTLAEVVRQEKANLVWHLQPVTGRSHQLRVELYRHAYPIVGDALYGSELPWNQKGIALRAFRMEFPKDDPQVKQLELPQEILLPDNFI